MIFYKKKKIKIFLALILIVLVQAMFVFDFGLAKNLDCLGPRSVISDSAFLDSFSDEAGRTSEGMDALAVKLLTKEQFSQYLVIKAIWINGEFDSLKDSADKVVSILEQGPMVRKAYGIGYPFYGRVDLGKRIYATLKRLESKEINNQEFLQRITPDLDVLIVVSQEDEGPWNIQANMDAIIKDYFIRYVTSYKRPWDIINKKLQEYTILTDIYADRDKALEILMQKGEYSLDFVYVPEHVWKNIPVFIMQGDIKYFRFIRDILFSLENDFRNSADIPSEFLHNYVLQTLSLTGDIKQEDLIEKLLKEHPYAELITMYEESRNIVTNKFLGGLKLAQQRGLVEDVGGKIVLTSKGQLYLEKIIRYREKLLKKGYDLSGSSFMKQRSAIEKSAEKSSMLKKIEETEKVIPLKEQKGQQSKFFETIGQSI